MLKPLISVVMGVYNGGKYLRGTIESILRQTFRDFEFIIINDGSTDSTGSILQEYADKDPRIKVIQQENQGLTKALIAGCQMAQGEYIARQDCGDISKPERLAKQLEHINASENISIVSCSVSFFGPQGETIALNTTKTDNVSVQKSLLSGKLNTIRGIAWHGTAFFPAALYMEAGGYRPEFYFAQDLDLWVRLAKRGRVSFCPEALYEARFREGDISGIYRMEQNALTKIILTLRDLEPADPKYKALLNKAGSIRPGGNKKVSRFRNADQMYFLGRCLKSQNNPGYRDYLQRCVKLNPLHVKAWISLITLN